jgi:hypothetical protein
MPVESGTKEMRAMTDAMTDIGHWDRTALVTRLAAGVWAVTGALALVIASQHAPLDQADTWCGVTGMSPVALGHCALCWGGAAALLGGLWAGLCPVRTRPS